MLLEGMNLFMWYDHWISCDIIDTEFYPPTLKGLNMNIPGFNLGFIGSQPYSELNIQGLSFH